MTETTLKNNVLRMIRIEFGRSVKVFKIHDVVTSGIPDLFLCAGGKFVAIELKRDERSKATPLQEYTLHEVRQSGGEAHVCRSVSEVRDIIRNVLEGRECLLKT